MNKPDIDNFVPVLIKKLKSNGFYVKWNVPRGIGESQFNDGFHMESENVPHPDLINIMTDINVPVKVILDTNVDAAYYVTEIQISGEYEKEAASFKGFLRHRNGQRTTFSTAMIKLKEDTFGVESKLWGLLENLKLEAYEYVFNDKFAQLKLFNAENTSETDPENEPDDQEPASTDGAAEN